MANFGQSTPGVGPYDPSKKEGSRSEYFKKVQSDLNKRFNPKTGMKKKTSPTREK